MGGDTSLLLAFVYLTFSVSESSAASLSSSVIAQSTDGDEHLSSAAAVSVPAPQMIFNPSSANHPAVQGELHVGGHLLYAVVLLYVAVWLIRR